jgi:hypothetical protein
VLQRNPNVKAIYCANDTMAMGVAQAVANAGKTGKVLVVGTDGIPEARKMVEAGQMTATIAQNPADIGATGLKLMVDAEKSGKVIPLDKAPVYAGGFHSGDEISLCILFFGRGKSPRVIKEIFYAHAIYFNGGDRQILWPGSRIKIG